MKVNIFFPMPCAELFYFAFRQKNGPKMSEMVYPAVLGGERCFCPAQIDKLAMPLFGSGDALMIVSLNDYGGLESPGLISNPGSEEASAAAEHRLCDLLCHNDIRGGHASAPRCAHLFRARGVEIQLFCCLKWKSNYLPSKRPSPHIFRPLKNKTSPARFLSENPKMLSPKTSDPPSGFFGENEK